MIDEWISIHWERGTRYYEMHLQQDLYEMHLQQDLFGDWVLTRVWGRRGTALGRIVHNPCVSYTTWKVNRKPLNVRKKFAEEPFRVFFVKS
jgi:hypothetical protein